MRNHGACVPARDREGDHARRARGTHAVRGGLPSPMPPSTTTDTPAAHTGWWGARASGWRMETRVHGAPSDPGGSQGCRPRGAFPIREGDVGRPPAGGCHRDMRRACHRSARAPTAVRGCTPSVGGAVRGGPTARAHARVRACARSCVCARAHTCVCARACARSCVAVARGVAAAPQWLCAQHGRGCRGRAALMCWRRAS